MKARIHAVIAAFLAVVCLGSLAAWLVSSPRSALRALQAAAERGDAAELRRRVDYPALRASVRATVVDRYRSTLPPAVYATMQEVTRGRMLDAMVEAIVAPQALSNLLAGRPVGAPKAAAGSGPPAPPVDVWQRWDDLSTVRLRLDTQTGGVTLLMKREGLQWRFVGLAP